MKRLFQEYCLGDLSCRRIFHKRKLLCETGDICFFLVVAVFFNFFFGVGFFFFFNNRGGGKVEKKLVKVFLSPSLLIELISL